MRRKGDTKGFSSIKSSMSSLHQKKSAIHKHSNLGTLMRQNDEVEEILYSYTNVSDLIHDDMDFTVEEFCDWTGADMEDLITDLIKVISKR